MFLKFKPVDIIALVTIIGGFVLMALKIDSTVSAVILTIAAYYFGKSTVEQFYRHKNGQ